MVVSRVVRVVRVERHIFALAMLRRRYYSMILIVLGGSIRTNKLNLKLLQTYHELANESIVWRMQISWLISTNQHTYEW